MDATFWHAKLVAIIGGITCIFCCMERHVVDVWLYQCYISPTRLASVRKYWCRCLPSYSYHTLLKKGKINYDVLQFADSYQTGGFRKNCTLCSLPLTIPTIHVYSFLFPTFEVSWWYFARYDKCKYLSNWGLKFNHGPLTRYAKLRIAHASGMPGTFSPPPTSKETAS